MKTFLKLVALFLLLQSFTCANDNDDDDSTIVTAESLLEQKQKILDYINSFPCAAAVGCSFIAFGDKPCGGPWEYLIYSKAVNEAKLKAMVEQYNRNERQFNMQTNAISNCMLVAPPAKVGCVNGKCAVIQ